MAMLLYDGPSVLTGEPIYAVLTGMENPSVNRKTGCMLQVWILVADVNPITALNTDRDESICGDCKLRGVNGKQRLCYVNVARAPTSIYKTKALWKPASNNGFKGRALRWGAYGDPTALPISLVKKYSALVKYHITGYTHQWRTCDPEFKHLFIASTDTEHEAKEAQALGWRTFRIKAPTAPKLAGERVCPASEERNYVRQCINCMACTGGVGANIVINIHGVNRLKYEQYISEVYQ